MKRRLGIIAALVVMAPISIGAGSHPARVGAKGWVYIGADSAELSSMGSCWETSVGRAKCGDAMEANYLRRSLQNQMTAPRGAKFTVKFVPNTDRISVLLRSVNGISAQTDRQAFQAGDSAGTYQYTVNAHWPDGQGTWLFQLKVE